MVIASTFVIDSWNGSKLMKTVVTWDSVIIDWASFIVFIGFPIFIGTIMLYIRSINWWTVTSISWFVVVTIYFAIFSLVAVYWEIRGCLDLVRYHPKLGGSDDPDSHQSMMTIFKLAMKLRMKQALSGRKKVFYLAHGADKNPEDLNYEEIRSMESFQSFTGIYARLTRQKFMNKFYTILGEPVREYTFDEVLDRTPFITRSSWGLESMYFRDRQTRFVAIIDGASALSKQQIKSSFICFILGKLMTIFVIVGVLVWFEVSGIVIVVAVAIYLILVRGTVRFVKDNNSLYKRILTRDNGDRRSINRNRNSNAMYAMHESFRITEPTTLFSMVVLGIEIVLFYIIPTIVFFISGDNRVGIVFIIAGIITMLRNVFNTPSVLRELGSLEGLEVDNDANEDRDGTSEWREKHRLGKIVSEISVGRRSKFWVGVFLFFCFLFCSVVVLAVANGVSNGDDVDYTFAPKEEFFYEGSKHLSYASCVIGRNIMGPDRNFQNDLADFAFLTSVAYLKDDRANKAMDTWFGDIPVANLSQNVTDFKKIYQKDNAVTSVSYKLFSFPDQDLQIIAIRGTNNQWDLLSDLQLWTSASLAQVVRAFLPFGEFWTPILPHLVKAISVLEEKSLKDVSYYMETTAFVESLKEKGLNVQIVGHCEYPPHLFLTATTCFTISFSNVFLVIYSSWWRYSNDYWSSNSHCSSSIEWAQQHDLAQNL